MLGVEGPIFGRTIAPRLAPDADVPQGGAGDISTLTIQKEPPSNPQTLETALRMFNPDITGFTAKTIKEARENQVLAGKVILILGAGPRGMGGAAAREIVLQGGSVIVSSRATETGEPRSPGVLDFVSSLGPNATWIGADVSKQVMVTDDRGRESSMFDSKRAIQDVIAMQGESGRLDGLIVGSGEMQNTPSYRRVDPNRFDEIMLQDAKGPLFAMIAAVEHMMKQKPAEGKVALVGSISGIGNAFQIEYSAAKGALQSGARALVDELEVTRQADLRKGREPHSVAINVLAPGVVNTPLLDSLTAEQRAGVVAKTGAERELDAREPGAMLAYLMGPYSKGHTGQVIPMLGRGEIPAWLEPTT